MSLIIWTRAKDDWQRDLLIAQKLKLDISRLLHLPCVSFLPLPAPESVPVANYVIFHSSNAVRFAMADKKLASAIRTAVKIFSIGQGTSETLKEFDLSATPGFTGNSAKQLADQILQSGVGGTFLIPTAKEVAFDSAAYLRNHGRTAETVPCYETTRLATKANGEELNAADIKNEAKNFIGAICFASPSAVEGFCNVFSVEALNFKKTLVPIAIGSTTKAEVLKHFGMCHLSKQSSVTSLFEEAQKHLGRGTVK